MAEVVLTVGILTRWIGSRNQLKESQTFARDLIGESMTFFESQGDFKKAATAQSELAYCYWREGSLDEARIMFKEALAKLTTEGNSRANAILGLAIVEWTDSRFDESLRVLNDSASLFGKIPSHAIRGAYHSQRAMVLRGLIPSGKHLDHIKQVIREYEEADRHFKLAHNTVYRADVKNNLGFLLYKISRYKDAHHYLEQARRLRTSVRDKIGVAQIDDTRAQVYIAEKKFKDAEAVARNAVRILAKSGHQCLLADALITQGIALARLKQVDHAQFVFQKAIEVAHQVGALNKAGLAALTMIEELTQLPLESLCAAYDRAGEWLEKSQSQDILLRLNAAGRTIFARLRAEGGKGPELLEDPIEALLNKPCDLQREVLKFEGMVIQRALAKSSGSLTRTATLLSMSYQALAYILESRQKNLMKERTPIRRRSRKDRNAEADHSAADDHSTEKDPSPEVS
ncbi:MAG TPA: tetratricopeptide repeat protein [Pyrinomonadaceae bacterium]|nr:tetratricopeptide repeat protein [Pyrinomonadaceae bacterium]